MCRPILQYFLRGVLRDLVILGQATLLLRKVPTGLWLVQCLLEGRCLISVRGAADRSRRSEKERNTIMEIFASLRKREIRENRDFSRQVSIVSLNAPNGKCSLLLATTVTIKS